MNRLWHKRLPEWEAFDRIEMRIIPRYKTSGMSGDEWRQHVEVTLYFKGAEVASFGARDMHCATAMLGAKLLELGSPIPDTIIELERSGLCDQPSCARQSEGRYLLKREFSRQGEAIDPAESSLSHYRQFCKLHARRGDCGREDADRNYEPMDMLTPEQSTNLVESPSSVVVVDARDVDMGTGEPEA